MASKQKTVYRGKKHGREEMTELKRIGKDITPGGFDYAGSVAVHFYKQRFFAGNQDGVTINQVMLGDVKESFAQEGMKNLRDHLMVQFGRKSKSEFIKE